MLKRNDITKRPSVDPLGVVCNISGMTLIEIVTLLLVVALISAAVITSFSSSNTQYNMERTRKEMESILRAAETYYWKTGTYPSSTTNLISSGLLPSSFTNINPFGNNYTISSNSTGRISIDTIVPSSVSSSGIPFSISNVGDISSSMTKLVDDVMILEKRKELFVF